KYPQADFIEQDIFEVTEKYDYVLASGALSFKVADNLSFYQQAISHMYQSATKAVAFNMLDKHSHIDDDTYAAYDPKEIADYCSAIATRVEVVTDVVPRDFTIFMY